MGLLVAGVLCAGVAGAGWTNRFSAVFTDYADGDRTPYWKVVVKRDFCRNYAPKTCEIIKSFR